MAEGIALRVRNLWFSSGFGNIAASSFALSSEHRDTRTGNSQLLGVSGDLASS